jgi:hypothetical protein
MANYLPLECADRLVIEDNTEPSVMQYEVVFSRERLYSSATSNTMLVLHESLKNEDTVSLVLLLLPENEALGASGRR